MNTTLAKILVNASLTGVAIALVALLWFMMQSYNTTVGNHIDHSTQAIIQNTEILTKLESSVGASIDVQKEQIGVLRELRDIIRFNK